MVNYTRGRSKIERLGLENECLRLKGEGKGSIKISRALASISGKKINATNVDNFFKSCKATMQDSKALGQAIENNVKTTTLKVMNNWQKMDDELQNLLKQASAAQDKLVGVDKKTGEPLIVKVKDLRLWKDVISDIAKVSEIRARMLGQIQQGGKHITFNFIENQYNDLRKVIVDAEDKFPGLNEWIEEQIVTSQSKKTVN